MKRVLSLILALVMLLAMFTMVGATESPDAAESTEAPVEPAPAAELTEEPAEPAPEVTETVTEPAPAAEEPETQTEVTEATEEPAEPEATETEPAVDETVTEPAEEPAQEPAVIEPVVEPAAEPAAENEITTISEPAPASVDAITVSVAVDDKDDRILDSNAAIECRNAKEGDGAYGAWKIYYKKGYIKLTASEENVVWHVALNAIDGVDSDIYEAVKEGGELYLLAGPALNEKYEYDVFIYATANGVRSNYVQITIKALPEPTATPEPTASPEPEPTLPPDMADSHENQNDYEKGVWLHVNNGGFDGENANKASVWVDFEDSTRHLPTEGVPTPTRGNGTFKGWYTEAPTEELVSKDGYSCWTTVDVNGQEIVPGETNVPEDVQVLYAAFENNDGPAAEKDKLVTYYLDWNGINGMWGECLTVSRSYSEGDNGYKLQPGDLMVRGLNWDGEYPEKWGEGYSFDTMEAVRAYWAARTFKGYKFLGWAQSPDAEQPDVDENTVIANGASIYAVWTKDGENSWTFERTADTTLTHLRFLTLRYSAHGVTHSSVTVVPYASPKGAVMADVTWTLTYGTKNTAAGSDMAPPVTLTVIVTKDKPFDGNYPGYSDMQRPNFDEAAGFTAKVNDDNSLTITNTDGKEHSVTVSVSAHPVDAEGNVQDAVVSSPADAPATVSFTHSYAKQEGGPHRDSTCIRHGYDTYQCTVCGAVTTKLLPTENHQWRLQTTQIATCTADGVRQDKCRLCDMTFTEYQQWLENHDMPTLDPTNRIKSIPATGHDYKKIGTEGTNGKGVAIIKEECDSCHEQDTVLCGDVSGDSNINVSDVLLMCQHIQHVDNGKKIDVAAGDINGDGTINVSDALLACQYIQGVKSTLG